MRKGSRAVKKLLLLGAGSALIFTMGGVGPAAADAGPHKTTMVGAGQTALISVAGGGRCASCHRAHTAKAEFLLKQAQPALCYTCHAGPGASLDVVDGINNDDSQALRGGGFEYAKIDGAGATKSLSAADPVTLKSVTTVNAPVLAAGTAVTSKHQIDGVTSGTIWGNGAVSAAVSPGKAGVTLECGSCHDPHGNGNYRILRPVPNDAATSAVAATATTPAIAAVVVLPVNIPDAITKVYTTTNYWAVADRSVPTVKAAAGVTPVAPAVGATDGYITNVAAWCTTCHTRYLAGSGSYKTPLTDANGVVDATFTYRHRSDRTDKDGVSRPNCIQCHVSHGSNVAMTSRAAAVADPGGADKVAGDAGYGDSRLLRVNNRGTCVMCHNV